MGWALAAPARAQPAFPEVIGAEPDWFDGPAGAFRPFDGAGAGRTFHVDGQTGLDTQDGSAGAPFLTIARGLEALSAGDTLVVHTGTYREQLRPPDLASPASRARPVRILAEPADGASVILDGSGVQPALEGNLDLPAGVSLHRDNSFVVEGFRVQNWSGYGLAVVQSSDVVVTGCTFADNGLDEPGNAVHLLLLSSRSARVWRNAFEAGAARGLDDRGTDSWIAHNLFRGLTAAGVKVGPYPAGVGSRVAHNRFLENPASEGALLLRNVRGVAVERNLLVGGSLQGIRVDAVQDCRVLQNTVVGFSTGLELRQLEGCRVEGNILAQGLVGLEHLSLYYPETTVDHNLFFDNMVHVEGGEVGTHDLVADPRFVDPAAGDFTLAADSPAVDAAPADLPVPEGAGARADLGALERGAGEPPWHHQVGGQVADPSPALGWRFVHRDPRATQLAYRVHLDRAPTFDTPALVDSNWVSSAGPRWTVPRGFELAAGRWYARVQTRDDAGATGPASDPNVALEVVPAPTCASQGGQPCQQLDSCAGEWRVASDQARCCLGSCQACPDADGDGYADRSCGGPDCDDGRASVHPGAEEDCENGLDDDCDGLTDADDPACRCIDHDLDGYGLYCPAGPDCDDSIASVHPGAVEECNYVDDDCDGLTDEGFDLGRDPDNCGECFWACRANEVCDLGACASSCGGGRTDCDRSCVDTRADLQNCGACGRVCELPQAGERCSAGECLLTACEAGWVNADLDDANGCEYACTPRGTEECGNGLDDDCDGLTDEDCGGGGSGGGCAAAGQAGSGLALLAALVALLGLRRRR
jgi:hypothetical protein